MTLLNLAQEVGLKPVKVSATQGGEFKSACPQCGGKDRFFIQPNKQMKNCLGYYRCRQCDTTGDTIQFAIEFKGMPFREAAQHVNAQITQSIYFFKLPTKTTFTPAQVHSSPNIWVKKANAFVSWAHNNMWKQKEILSMLEKRGISTNAIRTYKLGWNPRDIMRQKTDWGIEVDNKNTLWLPSGIVIPSLESNGNVLRIKIRRTTWKPADTIGKYIAIPGSAKGLTIIGDTQKDLMIVVESELDAFAIHHAVSDLACIVAIGSNIKNPDNVTDYLAMKKELLICHDNDKGGNVMWNKWKKLYSHAYQYPAPLGKDVGESIENGLRVRQWILMYNWINSPDKSLIEWVLDYINERTATREAYVSFEQEIAMGSTSPRALSGELQKGFRLMQKLVNECDS